MSAIWTSGEPVSPSFVAYSAKICFLTSASSGTWLLKLGVLGVTPKDGRDEGAAHPRRSTTGSVSHYHELPSEFARLVNVATHLLHQGLSRLEPERAPHPPPDT